jgi:hypothetical protein
MLPTRDNLASIVIAAFTIGLLMFLAWRVGGIIDDQRQFIEHQRIQAERAEERTADLKDAVERAVDDMRDEVRNPAGPRADTFGTIDRIEGLLVEMRDILERHAAEE